MRNRQLFAGFDGASGLAGQAHAGSESGWWPTSSWELEVTSGQRPEEIISLTAP